VSSKKEANLEPVHEQVILQLQHDIYQIHDQLQVDQAKVEEARKIYEKALSNAQYTEDKLRAICDFLDKYNSGVHNWPWIEELGLEHKPVEIKEEE
jgi:hypothetical protein